MIPTPFRVCSAALFSAMVASSLAVAAGTPSVLSEGSASSFWRQANSDLAPPYPANAPDPSEDVCVSIGYLIKEGGSTSDYALLNSWTSKHKALPTGEKYAGFAQGAVAAVMHRRYAPAQAPAPGVAPTPVYTAATFAYTGKADADQAALRARCSIADLPGLVAKAQKNGRKDGALRRAEMERARVQNPANITGSANGGIR